MPPRAAPARGTLARQRHRLRGLGAPHMVALHGEDDQTVREYRDGDDLRRIHWPASARTGELMVRQEDRPAKRRAVVILDHAPPRTRGRAEPARSSGASRWPPRSLRTWSGPGMPSTSSPPTPGPTPGSGTTTPTRKVETLACVTLQSMESLRGGVARRERADLAGRSGRLIGGPIDDVDGRSLAALRQPGSTGAAIVIDPASFGGHQRGGGDDVASASASVAALHPTGGWPPSSTRRPPLRSRRGAVSVGAQSVGTR